MVTKDTLIIDVLHMGDVQTLAGIFMSNGMGCLGCAMAHGETVGEACQVHGIDADALIEKLNKAIANG